MILTYLFVVYFMISLESRVFVRDRKWSAHLSQLEVGWHFMTGGQDNTSFYKVFNDW